MERSGDDNEFVNYLDIAVNIYSHKVTTKMYNKVDDFNFEVVSFTFPHSNISILLDTIYFIANLFDIIRYVQRFRTLSTVVENFIANYHCVGIATGAL